MDGQENSEHEYRDEPLATPEAEPGSEQAEEVIDDAIAILLDAVDDIRSGLDELRDELRREHTEHATAFRHEPASTGSGGTDSGHEPEPEPERRTDERPEPAHPYFRRIGRE